MELSRGPEVFGFDTGHAWPNGRETDLRGLGYCLGDLYGREYRGKTPPRAEGEKGRMKKIILSGLTGAVIGILIAAFVLTRIWVRPGPAAVAEVDGPDQGTIGKQSQGHLVGATPWKTPVGQNQPGKTVEDSNIPGDDGQASSGPIGAPFGEYKIPVSGELTTDYYYGGLKVGEGVHWINGETIVNLTEEGVSADTRFSDTSNLKIDLPEQPWNLYIGVKTDVNQVGLFGGIAYSRSLWGGLEAGIRAEYDGKVRVGALLGYEF